MSQSLRSSVRDLKEQISRTESRASESEKAVRDAVVETGFERTRAAELQTKLR